VAQLLSWLSAHKFKTVLAQMKSAGQVEVLEGKDPILRFTSHFFAGQRYQKSISTAVFLPWYSFLFLVVV
jgi:hypothetical protein